MTKETIDPQVLEEPGHEREIENVWMRGVFMLILAALYGVAKAILFVTALFQFVWMVAKEERNEPVADFGEELADWTARVVRFQTGATEDKPFPFSRWGGE